MMAVHRQFGSKARVADVLLALVPDDVRVWVEGFAGTASLTLAKRPHRDEHLNDLNRGVVNLFAVLRDNAMRERLCALLELTPYAQAEFVDCRHSMAGESIGDPVEHARQFLVSSWQGFGPKQVNRNSWRLERRASSVISRWLGLPEQIRLVAERLRMVHVHCRHVADIVGMFGRDTDALLYLDPPYPIHTLATHEHVYAVTMSDGEHDDLACQLRSVRCRVLLTMAAGTVYSDALRHWHVTPYPVRGLRNTVKTELALTNYPPPRAAQTGCAS
jgi:DNA adenine methylase